MKDYDWYSDDPNNKQVRRDAANSFLSAVLDDPHGMGAGVTGLEPGKRQLARIEFEKKLKDTAGAGPLPPKVEVICIEEDTRKRADLVIFVLKKKGAITEEPRQKSASDEDLWDGRWVAAWAPY
jgi:hypothetical protein